MLWIKAMGLLLEYPRVPYEGGTLQTMTARKGVIEISMCRIPNFSLYITYKQQTLHPEKRGNMKDRRTGNKRLESHLLKHNDHVFPVAGL